MNWELKRQHHSVVYYYINKQTKQCNKTEHIEVHTGYTYVCTLLEYVL